MNDYYGRELNIGDLALCLPKLQNNFYFSDDRISLLIGKNEVFRLQRKNVYSVCNISDEVLIRLSPVNTDKLIKKYAELKNAYEEYMQQEINSNKMISNLQPGDIVVRNNKSEQTYVYIGYGDFITMFSNKTKNTEAGYLYIALSVFGNASGLKMTAKNIDMYQFSLNKAISYLYSANLDWYNKVDKSKVILSKSPIMIKKIKGKLKLSSLNAKYICDSDNTQYIQCIEFKKK